MGKDEILKALKEIVDPELGINVVDLGLIYDIKEQGDKIVIDMTLTSPFCPLGSIIVENVKEVAKRVGGKEVEINLVFDPPWSPERMSDEARKKLGIE